MIYDQDQGQAVSPAQIGVPDSWAQWLDVHATGSNRHDIGRCSIHGGLSDVVRASARASRVRRKRHNRGEPIAGSGRRVPLSLGFRCRFPEPDERLMNSRD
jgi:hypothetical protein